MIIFATTRQGYLELEAIIRTGIYPVWVGGEVLNESELTTLRSLGVNLTDFNDPIDPKNDDALAEALTIIAEHHPAERVWLERQL